MPGGDEEEKLSCTDPYIVYVVITTTSPEGGSLDTPRYTPKCAVRVFRVFMNTPPEYFEYSDYSIEYSGCTGARSRLENILITS